MNELTDEALYNFLIEINISPEQAKRILSSETLKNIYIPQYYNLYHEMINNPNKMTNGKSGK